MSRMDWTARLAGYMNWMGRCCCSAWITPPILPSLGEYMRRARYRRKKYVTLLKEGRLSRFDYTEIDHCCQNFSLVDGWLESEGLQRRGPVGRAEARLVRSSDVIRVVTEKIQQNETVFLHPFGVDEECDDARLSLSEE